MQLYHNVIESNFIRDLSTCVYTYIYYPQSTAILILQYAIISTFGCVCRVLQQMYRPRDL